MSNEIQQYAVYILFYCILLHLVGHLLIQTCDARNHEHKSCYMSTLILPTFNLSDTQKLTV